MPFCQAGPDLRDGGRRRSQHRGDEGYDGFLGRLQGLGPASEEAGFAGGGEEGRVLVADFSATQVGTLGLQVADFREHQLAGPAAAATDGAVIDAGAFHGRTPSCRNGGGRWQ